MDKILKISIIGGILVIVISISYYFVVRPIRNEKKLKACLQEANKDLNEARESNKLDENLDGEGGIKKIGNIYQKNTEQERVYLAQRAAFDEIQKRAEKAEKECFVKYPQK